MPSAPRSSAKSWVGSIPTATTAIYDALARMAQDFSLRHPLIDGHGNFGAPGPEAGPAAMRYTECRLAPLALALLDGIDEGTVDFIPNYDGSEVQPVVLPARFPNLLVNGSQGIAVGMATNIPPHNLGEIIDATLHLIEHPEATPDELMQFVKGPDFPTGALILGRSGMIDAYRTGRGSVKMRAVAEITESRSGADQIIVTEIPYQTSVGGIELKIADAIESGDLTGISDVQNDSAGRVSRLVITLKRDANANVVLNNLYKHTPLQTSFGVHMLALVDGVPRLLNLAQALTAYVAHQVEVVTRRSEFRLRKALARAHIVEGLLRAIDMLDAVIATIRGSEDRPAARANLMSEPFGFSEEQANHILDMTLGRLTRLGRSELETEIAELRATIAELEAILSDPVRLRAVISTELESIKRQFAQPRRTRVIHDPGELFVEDLIEDEELVVTLTRAGYIKAVQSDAFRAQARGGRGVQGTRLKEEDLIDQVLHTTAHSHLLLFSNRGKVYRLRAHEVPVKERNARGTPIVNLLPLEPTESIQAIVETRTFDPDQYLLFATKSGQVKKTAVLRVRQVPAGRVHRHQLERRRRARAGRPYGRRGRSADGEQERHGDPIRGVGGAPDGPERSRGSGHAATRRRRGRLLRRGSRRRGPADRHRRRLRQTDEARPLQRPDPRRPGRSGHQADSAPRSGRRRAHGIARRRDHRRLVGRRDDPHLGARDRGSGARRDRGPRHEPRRRPDRGRGGEGPAGDRGGRRPAEVADRVTAPAAAQSALRPSVVPGQEIADGGHVELALLDEGCV